MNEIDFIPEWYASSQRRQLGYRRQYVVMAAIFCVLIMVSFIGQFTVSKANAGLEEINEQKNQSVMVTAEYAEKTALLGKLQAKHDVLSKVDHKTRISNVLGELSYLIGDSVIVSKLEINAEDYAQAVNSGKRSRVRLASKNKKPQSVLPESDFRFRVMLGGIAQDGSDVATLISNLERSGYFAQVVPGFSKNKEISGKMVTEFEIGCYLSNYIERKK